MELTMSKTPVQSNLFGEMQRIPATIGPPNDELPPGEQVA